ncbi:SPJ_0845 family protein [Loigolactobacillus backii]|nr:SPJ_0845 family protein [Loigolactobacillus backii]MDA5387093.1 SPJ_0845 family protein [Loigolactobacillus backii]MDA5389684.1 SPJ_0845 family protein [Loigolactobacillus backii]
MGLTIKQDNSLNELFDKFAIDPKVPVEDKPKPQKKDKQKKPTSKK